MLDRHQTWFNGIHTKYNYVALVQGHLVKSFWLNYTGLKKINFAVTRSNH